MDISPNQIKQIIRILKQFNTNQHRRLNLEKVSTILNIPQERLMEILGIILECQELFTKILERKELKFFHINGVAYLELQQSDKDKSMKDPDNIIFLSQEEIDLISDATFVYRKINGNGFKTHFTNGLEKKIIEIVKYHPYFFKRVNSHLIPSELCLALGDVVLQYKKIHKKLDEIQIEDTFVKVKNNGSNYSK